MVQQTNSALVFLIPPLKFLRTKEAGLSGLPSMKRIDKNKNKLHFVDKQHVIEKATFTWKGFICISKHYHE